MTEALHHRGPDGVGYYEGPGISLGHRRLSIIDLEGGKQPIANETGDVYLVCNGEIYNSPQLRTQLQKGGHRFKSRSDVEVILHLYEDYGDECVTHLRGMFAFALWDQKQKKLLLARDHLGQKPLFYWHSGSTLVFASEPKAILASGMVQPRLDIEALWHYSSLRFVPDDRSFFSGIRKLPAASVLTFSNDKIRERKYWSLDFNRKMSGSEGDVRDRLSEVLEEVVTSHLLSDVPVGAFLSGGIDSTTIASMMAKSSSDPISSFSIGVREEGFNELPYARQVAEAHGMVPHEDVVDANLVQLLPRMVYHLDEPADPYGVGIYLVSRLARESRKVALSGDGADEIFAGYDRYAGQKIVDYYRWLPSWMRHRLIRPLIHLIPESFGYKSLAQKARWVHEMSLHDHGARYATSISFLRFTMEAKHQLFSQSAMAELQSPDSLEKILVHYDAPNATNPVDKMLYTDLMTRIPDHNLVLGDRMSMAHSLEVRSPFLDHRLVEFAAQIPASMKIKRGRLKHILREVASGYLPSSVLNRPKQGFGFPLGQWLRTDLRNYLKGLTRESRMVEAGVFNPKYIEEMIQQHLSGKVDHNYRIWILINMEIWHRLYIERESVEALGVRMEKAVA